MADCIHCSVLQNCIKLLQQLGLHRSYPTVTVGVWVTAHPQTQPLWCFWHLASIEFAEFGWKIAVNSQKNSARIFLKIVQEKITSKKIGNVSEIANKTIKNNSKESDRACCLNYMANVILIPHIWISPWNTCGNLSISCLWYSYGCHMVLL